jgi:rhodanese-related sulfurtransferase
MINHQDAVLIDVREDGEFAEGHILNAIHIPLGALSANLNRLEKYRNAPIIVGCRSGNRSAHACRLLKKKGFENVYNLHGGILAWQNANLPVVTGKH